MSKAPKPDTCEPFELPEDREQAAKETTPCIYCGAPIVHWPIDVPVCDQCDQRIVEGTA